MPSLLPIFREKLIPWAQQDLSHRLIVARPVMKKTSVPYGVELTKKKIPGKRVLVRTRDDGPQKIVCARWPEAALHELEVPKLVCIMKGIADYQVGKYVVTCGEGHFILLPPHTPNTTGGRSHLEGQNRVNGFCEVLQLIPFRDGIHCRWCFSKGTEHWEDAEANCEVAHPEAVHLFNLFQEEALSEQEGSDLLSQQLLLSVFVLLLREINAGRQLKNGRVPPISTFDGSPEQQMRNFIKTHLHQTLTIEKVARQMYMSPAKFTQFVRRETGQSFVELITDYRIEETRRLLRETDWSMAAVARHVGYKSSNYFITLFGKREGCSPGEYRNTVKK